MKVLAAIPCYNERIPVAYVVTLAREHVDTNFLEKSLIKKPPLVVDGGSLDGTAAVARAAGPARQEQGKGAGDQIRACERQNVDFFILHTGQHYSYTMDRVFFEQLELPEARYNLDVGAGTHGEQTGKILRGVEQLLQNEQQDTFKSNGYSYSLGEAWPTRY